MKIRLIYTASLTALAAGLLLACGSDDDDTTPASDAGSTDSSTTTPDSSAKLDAGISTDAATTHDASTTSDSSTPTDSGNTNDAGTADSGTDASDAAVAPTFTNVYAQIIGPICSGCHTGGTGASSGKLVMDNQADAFNHLVGVTAAGSGCGTTGDVRVVAGSPSTSLLFEKTSETTPPCGSRMPLGQSPLSTTQIELISGWISAGALDN